VIMVAPTWCGLPGEGEARVAPFLRIGTRLAGTVEAKSYGTSLTAFDPYLADGLRIFMDSCWLAKLERQEIELAIEAMASAVGPGCAIFTHEFRGAASRIPEEATAFGLRRDHVLIEILAAFPDQPAKPEERYRQWTRATREAFSPIALPGAYSPFLAPNDWERAGQSYGGNAGRLLKAKRHYDPDRAFCSAIPLLAPFEAEVIAGRRR
jgi:hypothetical protein